MPSLAVGVVAVVVVVVVAAAAAAVAAWVVGVEDMVVDQ
jgi:hypothetical protein